MTREALSRYSVTQSLPQEVPSNLTPEEYYALGVRYKKARGALNWAINLDPQSEAGRKAQVYLSSKLPKYPVPEAAIRRNIKGYNYWAQGDRKRAKQVFRALIEEYPDFEWPYANLGRMYVQEGVTDEARSLLDMALEINPQYFNAWMHYVALYEYEEDKEGAITCIRKAEAIDPENSRVQNALERYDLKPAS